MKKKWILLLLVLISVFISSFKTKFDYSKYKVNHKSKYIVYDYQIDAQRVLNAKEINYYGLDVANARLVNGTKLGEEYKEPNFWVNLITVNNKLSNQSKTYAKWCKKKFNNTTYEISKRYKMVPATWIEPAPKNLYIEDIQNIVKSYNEIRETSGIGMVIIVQSLEKSGERTTVVITFFDIKTKDILWASKVIGIADGMGFTKHWAVGILDACKNYKSKVLNDNHIVTETSTKYNGLKKNDKVKFTYEGKIYYGRISELWAGKAGIMYSPNGGKRVKTIRVPYTDIEKVE
jgi:hypothetical protein